ncbi:LppU/SCO3897 family protein [Micromonospora rubida]|uniref:LppU/SCO3897 family protein n=1 Tax=Micromonospora rubida TaxID=2697657 RepID=UPI00137731B9|nr:hypothetical protein [Micromonospora rubida]NBE81433.1 hypothetical protein [Micromonospora rubida]
MNEQLSTLTPAETETTTRGPADTGSAASTEAPAGEHAGPDEGPGDDPEGGARRHPLLPVLTVLGVVAVLVGTLVVLGLRYDVAGRLLAPDRAASARVGDCLARLPDVAESGQHRSATARVVDCSSPEAVYGVVGRLDGQSAERARDGLQCETFVARGGTYYTYSSVPPGGTGYLLCLAPRS